MSTETMDDLGDAAELRPGRGGWDGWAARHASPALQRHLRKAEAQERREAKVEAERLAQERESYARTAFAASIELAEARGEEFSMRAAMQEGGTGFATHAERVAYYSALGDAQDERDAARKRRFTQAVRAQLVKLDEHSLASAVDAPPVNVAAAQAAVTAALQVSPAGRTPAEMLAVMSAQADLSDALERAAAQRELAELLDSGAGLAVGDGQRSEAVAAVAERIRARAAAIRNHGRAVTTTPRTAIRSVGFEAGYDSFRSALRAGGEMVPERDVLGRAHATQWTVR